VRNGAEIGGKCGCLPGYLYDNSFEPFNLTHPDCYLCPERGWYNNKNDEEDN